jgi:hypothetical protein
MSESVAEVRRAFDSWRRQDRSRRRVYPESLRRRALALRWDGTDAELGAALGVSSGAVVSNWRKRPSAAAPRARNAVVAAAGGAQSGVQFVELGAMAGLGLEAGSSSKTRSVEVALESGDGRSLRVRGELDAAMLVGLAQVALGSRVAGGTER